MGADPGELGRKRKGVEVAFAVEQGEYRRDWWEACRRPFLRAQVRARCRTGFFTVDESEDQIDALRKGISQAGALETCVFGDSETPMAVGNRAEEIRRWCRSSASRVNER